MAKIAEAEAGRRTAEFEFRGGTYEIDLGAARSVLTQRDIALVDTPEGAARGWEAYDRLFCGRLREYLARIPDESGGVSEYGCGAEDFTAFVRAGVEAARAKN